MRFFQRAEKNVHLVNQLLNIMVVSTAAELCWVIFPAEQLNAGSLTSVKLH